MEFFGTLLLAIFCFTSYLDKSGNEIKVDAEVVQAINYTENSIVDKDIEYKSDLIIKYSIDNKEYQAQITEEPSTYLKGDKFSTYVKKDDLTTVIHSASYIDLLVSIFFFIVSLFVLLLSDRFRKIFKKMFYKIFDKNENKELYTDVFHETNKKKKESKLFHKLLIFAGCIFLIVLSVYSFFNIRQYIYYQEKSTYNKDVTVVKSNQKGSIVSWIDEDNKEHMDYLNNSSLKINDKLNISVEKNTNNSRTVKRKMKITDLIGIPIALGAIAIILFSSIKKIKK